MIEALSSFVRNRRVVLVGGPLVGATALVKRLRALGAERVLVIASGVGTGDQPDATDADWVVVEHSAADIVAGIRAEEAMLRQPPTEVLDALARFDAGRDALVILQDVASVSRIADRPLLGARPPEWVALEDKTVVDALWDDWGVARVPSQVVPVDAGRLGDAADALDVGMGTAWAGDARDGFHGGAVFLRWVRTEADRAEAVAFFSAHCDRVRVMPFLEGVPCSIHGVVFPDGVAVLRPVEMVCLRPAGQPRILYGGCSTFWDPPAEDREQMREVARVAGRGLAEQVGYRGGFTVDGVLSAEGFRPTELNTRMGGGVGTMARGLPDIPFHLLQLALVTGRPAGIAAAAFESMVVAAADATRAGGVWSVTPASPPAGDTVERDLVLGEHSARLAEGGEPSNAQIVFGPGVAGGFVRVTFDPARTPVGPSVGPRAVAALALADALFGTGFGPLEPSRPVR